MPTPLRNIRVPDDVWLPAMERAKADGTALSGVIVDALRAYGSGGAAVTVLPVPPSAGRRETPGEIRAKVATARQAAESGRAIAAERKRDPKNCRHENMRMHRGWCADCETMAVKRS